MIIPALRYDDPKAALAWLKDVFQLKQGFVFEEDGQVVHAELWMGDGCIMFGPTHDLSRFTSQTGRTAMYVMIDDPDALYAHTVDQGAEVSVPPYDTSYGSREYSVLDLEGNEWSF